ncbi:MAG: SPFH domain-containing protein, partial [Thermoplasmata archaeon]|nr:SPFH domain-containing protein [Thermoplasmata archaeon]
ENIMYRIPRNIQWNDNIIVREDEYAVFFRDGKVMHVFDRPGRYALTTENVPVLATLGAALTGIRQLGEIYYLQKRELRGKFGTPEPLAFRDPDFGVVRIRAFGEFSYKVIDPILFITQFVGTEGITESESVLNWLREQLVTIINHVFGKLKKEKRMSILDAPAYLKEMEQLILDEAIDNVKRYGLKITKLAGFHISLPEEVQTAIDKRGAMGALGVDYLKYQTGKAIESIGTGAAKGNEAVSLAGLGAGVGAGIGIGSSMIQGMKGKSEDAKLPSFEGTKKCPRCGADVPSDAKFCPNCGAKLG